MTFRKTLNHLSASAFAMLVFSTANAANLMPLPEYNSLSVLSDASEYEASGEFAHYTSVGTGILILTSKDNPSEIRVQIEEQADWLANFSVIPALRDYLAVNKALIEGAQVEQKERESFKFLGAFNKVVPASQSYAITLQLSDKAKRDQLSKLLTNIAPGIFLSECALDNIKTSLKLN